MRRKVMRIGFICLLLLITLGFALPLSSNDTYDYKDIITDSTSYIALSDLKEEYNNPNIIGAIRIPGTDIAEILVQGKGNKILIYGHNSSSLNVPFKELENYYDEDYYEDHKIIELITENGIKQYEIFSVYVETDDWSYMAINFDNPDSWYNHISELKEKSWYDTKVELSKDAEILILQTCSHHKDFKNYDKKYLLIIAKKI